MKSHDHNILVLGDFYSYTICCTETNFILSMLISFEYLKDKVDNKVSK